MEVLSASSSSLEVISTQSLTSLADTPPDTEQLSSLVESVASAHSVGTQTEDESSIVSEVTSHDIQSARSEVKTTQWRPTPAPRRSITPKSAVRWGSVLRIIKLPASKVEFKCQLLVNFV